MESPRRGALDPGSHPRTATEAAHSGAYGHCNTIQMYTTVCVDVFRYACAGWEYGNVPTKGQCRLRYFLPVSCLFVSGALDISIIAGKFTQIPKPCQPMTCSPRGHWALTLRDINEKATSRLPEEIPRMLHQ